MSDVSNSIIVKVSEILEKSTREPGLNQMIPTWQPPPIPHVLVPTVHFRLKGNRLQQLMDDPSGGRFRWWVNVPTVDESEPDVIAG